MRLTSTFGSLRDLNQAVKKTNLLSLGQMNLVRGQSTGGFIAKQRIGIVFHVLQQYVDNIIVVAHAAQRPLYLETKTLITGVNVLHQDAFGFR